MSLKDNDVGSLMSLAGPARAHWVRGMMEDGKARACPVCYHDPQLRGHVFTTTMALALIHLYHRGAPAGEDTIPEVVKTGDSLKKLVMWGLVAEGEGQYRLAPDGQEVVAKRLRVARQCMAANGYALWFSGDKVWLDETLNQRYSYENLMKAAV